MHRIGVTFETAPFAEATEITGPVKLVLWVSSNVKDMDMFVTVRNIDAEGNDVWEVGQQGQKVPVAKGWLRASHRKLDAKRSLPYRPFHAHNERWWLQKGEIVECQVEVISTSIVIKKGNRLRLDITPKDGVGSGHFTHYHADYNDGALNTLHVAKDKPAYIMLPIIPPKEEEKPVAVAKKKAKPAAKKAAKAMKTAAKAKAPAKAAAKKAAPAWPFPTGDKP